MQQLRIGCSQEGWSKRSRFLIGVEIQNGQNWLWGRSANRVFGPIREQLEQQQLPEQQLPEQRQLQQLQVPDQQQDLFEWFVKIQRFTQICSIISNSDWATCTAADEKNSWYNVAIYVMMMRMFIMSTEYVIYISIDLTNRKLFWNPFLSSWESYVSPELNCRL